jgi:hypothetical protein
MSPRSTAAREATDRDLDLDYTERTGFLTGKAFAIADWRHRKDKREFDALQNRLNVRRWRLRVYDVGGEKLDQLRANARKRQNAHHERERIKRRGRVLTCEQCGAQWCVVPRAPGACWNAKACSLRCQRALWKARPGVREANRQRKNALRGSTGLCWCGAPKPKGHGWWYCAEHSRKAQASA